MFYIFTKKYLQMKRPYQNEYYKIVNIYFGAHFDTQKESVPLKIKK